MNDLHPTRSATPPRNTSHRWLLAIAVLLLAALTLPLASPAPTQAQAQAAAKVTPEAVELRNIGIAQLENERPEKAVETFERLIKIAPADPLGYANLAIAHLRQQQTEPATQRIEEALTKVKEGDPRRADLLRIRGDVLQWAGDQDAALASYSAAVDADPNDLESLYALYRQSTNINSDEARAAGARSARRLAKLRPENVVVILAEGQRAIAAGEQAPATASFLRLRELLWQAQPVATKALGQVLETLEKGDATKARVPALRLENVLKITPMYRESLRELSTGIQGVPVDDFLGEEPSSTFGGSKDVTLTGQRLAEGAGADVAVGDLNGDLRPDIVRLAAGGGGTTVELWLSAGDAPAAGEDVLPARAQGKVTQSRVAAPAGLEELLLADLNNDGHLDVLAWGPGAFAYLRNPGTGQLVDATAEAGLAGLGGAALEAIDYDIEGDLDLVLVGGGAANAAPKILRNSLEPKLEEVGARVLPQLNAATVTAVVASDVDRDGDLDLLLAGPDGLTLLDNLRQGRFEDITATVGLSGVGAVTAMTTGDMDNDGYPEILTAGADGLALRQRAEAEPGARAAFGAARTVAGAAGAKALEVRVQDLDNDGRLDVLAAGPGGLEAIVQSDDGSFRSAKVSNSDGALTGVDTADLDGDGDLDVLATGPSGLHRFDNTGAEGQLWLAVRLRGLDKGSSKNNVRGLGSVVEVRLGDAYQFREARGDVVHFGLGSRRSAYLMRVVWTNGVPQTRVAPRGNQLVVEEQLLKGSCPFLYAWDGDRMAFVTDLLWGAPLGLPVAAGVWAPSDPRELVRVDGAVPVDGRYELRITEELWEAAFIDRLRLWVVDHPRDVEVASSLRMAAGPIDHRVLASRQVTPVARAWDGAGRDVTQVVRFRDEIYADGYEPSAYQGIAARPWGFIVDLGDAPAAPVRLHLDGWIFPSDASLNLAVAQRQDLSWTPPRLEVEVDGQWVTLMDSMGFPPGKTKTMVVDTPPLPPGARRLRMVTTQWLSWDRIAWARAPVDDVPVVRDRLTAQRGELAFRGFSQLVRSAPNAPHGYEYHNVDSAAAPWLPLPGRYTRYGDVLPLLENADDLSVILAPGDEIALTFDASHLPVPAPGWQRTVFLESHGWDKDADRNTYRARQVEPLPFHGMDGYPGPDGTMTEDDFPDTPAHLDYLENWLTREVPVTEGV